jgi:signal transduction histidine kinase
MPTFKMSSHVNTILYRGRHLAAAIVLLFVLYNTIFFGFYVPFGGPYLHWRPDSRLVVDVPVEQSASLLTAGDEILAINDQPSIRTNPIYPLPLATEYDFTILRDGTELTVLVPVYAPINDYAANTFLATIILSFMGWLVGAIMLFLARRNNHQAIHAGYIFLLSAAVLIGIQGGLEGVPGAWIAGHCLIYLLAASWIYLGLLPRSEPLSIRTRKWLAFLYGLAIVFSVIAAYEVIALFPKRTSVQELIGVSLYSLGFLLSALGLMTCVLILVVRIKRLPHQSYIRQQLAILLLFFAIGVFPTTLLTIIPRALFDVVVLPFPVGIALMMFIPAGYLFVIYRRGFLGLDPFFSRTVYLVLLAMTVFGFYTSGLYLVQRWLNLGGAEAVIPATVIFFPALLLTISASGPINELVQYLIYGKDRPEDGVLAQFALALSTSPELTTLNDIVGNLAGIWGISQAVLALQNEKGQLVPVSTIGEMVASPMKAESLTRFPQPLLRSAVRSFQKAGRLFQHFSWAELLIPVTVRNEQIGLLALARPGSDGYFNARQVTFLNQAASVLAVGSDNIALFELTRALSRQSLVVQEQERKHLAARIHDEPLQQITYVAHVIDQVLATSTEERLEKVQAMLPQAKDLLKQTAVNLRQICVGLHPPFWDQGVELAVREVVSQFQIQYELDVCVEVEKQEWAGEVAEEITISLCHILTESLNNVLKHAAGTPAHVKLQWGRNQLRLQVTDNGPGSDTAVLPFSDLVRKRHFGIVGMHEWARLVQGSLRLTSNEPAGMKVMFSCPLT